MKTKNLIPIIALTTIVFFSSRDIARAGGPTAGGTTAAATVKGVVRLEGTAPKAKPISMATDPDCARQHASPVLSPEVATDAKGDLQNVIVFVSDGLGDRTFDPPSRPVVIDQKGCMYQPHVLALRAGQDLQVVNDDPVTHNIHPMPTNNREWNKAELPGSKVDESFSREEVAIPVKCNVHPWMRGYVAVFKHPFFFVTGKDGSFDLSNLPPGTYTLTAWHEKLGKSTQQVTIGANETKTVDFVFKSM
jgi:plastocyanin